METLVITLREGMEAGLAVGLILAYLNQVGRTDLKRYVYFGLALAALVSLAGAAGFSQLGFDPDNEILEGASLAMAAALVGTLVVWMWRASKNVKRYVEGQLESLTGGAERRRVGWGLVGFTFVMVFREGVEIVLFLAALSLTAAGSWLQLVGGITGLGLAGLFGFLLIRGSVRIDLRRFFGITGLVLMILAARLVAGSVHAFTEAGLLPSAPLELSIIGFVVKDSTSIVTLIVLFLLPALTILPGLQERLRRGGSAVR